MDFEKKYSIAEPYFSIIVPSYNREKFIARTLQSVQDQIFQDFEVIVVDDCSTDNTVEVVQPFLKDKRFKLIQNTENLERSKSRNIGMRNARGKFLTLLDSDDLMYPNCLEDAYKFTIDEPKYLFFRNYFEMVNEEGQSLKKFDKTIKGNEIAKLAKENYISCIGVFTHRDIYKNMFFDEDPRIIVSEDWEYWLRVRANYKLGTIKKLNSAFTEHPNRSIAKFDPIELENRKMIIIEKVLSHEATRKVYAPYEKDMKVAAYLFVAIHANIAGFPKIALAYLKKASQISIFKSIQFRSLVVLKNALKGVLFKSV